MYRGFVIKKSTIDNLPPLNCGLQARTEYENTFSSIEEYKKLQRKAIKTEILGHNGIIDADKLMQACMPQTHE